MLQPPTTQWTRPPTPLRIARVVLWIQTAGTAIQVALLFGAIASIERHGQSLSDAGRFVSIAGPIVFVAALIVAIFVASRRPWVRPVAIVLEVISIISGLVTLVSGALTGVGAVGLSSLVIVLLLRPEVTAWLNQRPDATTEHSAQEQPGYYGNQPS